jgi:regulatory protein
METVFLMEKQITALKAQKKNPDRVNVYLDGEFAFGVSRFVGAGLRVGQNLSPDEISLLDDADTREKAYQTALRFIGYKPRTEREVIKRLESGGYSAEIICSVLDELRQKEYINDAEYAAQWAEIRAHGHPRGRRLIAQELRSKGVANEIIQNALLILPDEREMAIRLGEAFLNKNKNLEDRLFIKKMEGVLARKGFDFGVIREVVGELIQLKEKS